MKELAEFLKTERLNRNLTLEAVSERSGISTGMLMSFEDCDFERFGASLLIRNTIRAYCQILQIDSEPLIEKFSSKIEECNVLDSGIRRYGHQMKILRRRRRLIGLPLFGLFLISAAVFYGGTWVSEKRSRMFAPPDADRVFTQEEFPAELHELPAPGPDTRVRKPGADLRKADEAIRTAEIYITESEMAGKKTEGAGKTKEQVDMGNQGDNSVKQPGEEYGGHAVPDSSTSSRPAFSNSTEEAVADDEPAGGLEVPTRNKFAVEADGKVWIQVRIDDKETLSQMLHAGDRREWTADESLQVIVGNAGGVHMKWNDRPLAAPRDPGRVLRFRLPDYAKAE